MLRASLKFPVSMSFSLRNSAGFTYLGLMIFMALMAAATTAALHVGVLVQRRAAETELLAIGVEFRKALISYAVATPAGQKRHPGSLQELLKDPRFPNPTRHLRKIYVDPMTGRDEWGLVELQEGAGILGVHSLSEAAPIKLGNFDALLQDFTNKTSYLDWKFMVDARYMPAGLNQAVKPPDNGQPSNGNLHLPKSGLNENSNVKSN